jgi:hypothetical protein
LGKKKSERNGRRRMDVLEERWEENVQLREGNKMKR